MVNSNSMELEVQKLKINYLGTKSNKLSPLIFQWCTLYNNPILTNCSENKKVK